uniref:Sulfotransferase n=1 Tax=Zonotrichia albicollis TaxID=44394 RepID=A0A8D2NFI6_ZONAL
MKKIVGLVENAEAAANSMRRDELLFSYKGILYPTTVCSPESFKALESFEARRDDVILAGYPKSGEYILILFINKFLMTKLRSPRFMVTHLRPENLPKSIFQSNAKIFLLIRNPKDVATSYYHYSNGLALLPSYETWDDFFTDFMTKKSKVYFFVCFNCTMISCCVKTFVLW